MEEHEDKIWTRSDPGMEDLIGEENYCKLKLLGIVCGMRIKDRRLTLFVKNVAWVYGADWPWDFDKIFESYFKWKNTTR